MDLRIIYHDVEFDMQSISTCCVFQLKDRVLRQTFTVGMLDIDLRVRFIAKLELPVSASRCG